MCCVERTIGQRVYEFVKFFACWHVSLFRSGLLSGSALRPSDFENHTGNGGGHYESALGDRRLLALLET